MNLPTIPTANHIEFSDIYGYYTPPFYERPWLLAGIIIGTIIVGVSIFLILKKVFAKKLTPNQWAYEELAKLTPTKAVTKHDFKIFYSTITKTLKLYLIKRYELNLLAKTDDEVIIYLTEHNFEANLVEDLKKITDNALLVKFANQDIIKTQAEKDLALALSFVERTKPAPQE